MYNKPNYDKMESLRRIVVRLSLKMIETETILNELNHALGDPKPFERNVEIESVKSESSECKPQEPTDETVVFEKFDDGTPEGITLPLLIGRYKDGSPMYF